MPVEVDIAIDENGKRYWSEDFPHEAQPEPTTYLTFEETAEFLGQTIEQVNLANQAGAFFTERIDDVELIDSSLLDIYKNNPAYYIEYIAP